MKSTSPMFTLCLPVLYSEQLHEKSMKKTSTDQIRLACVNRLLISERVDTWPLKLIIGR
uniref:Uncharacterized protein n=1 Tax=Anguilla anguilla TaxID=7936 RepID=A0A0E9XQU7_ANGAN